MWNDEWERQNQDQLRAWYWDERNAPSEEQTVRRIICAGCDQIFYTRIKSKKYCNYNTCGKIGNYRLQKQHRFERRKDRVCAGCGAVFTPKRSDARYCSNACRQRAYRQSVTDKQSGQNVHPQQP